MARSLRFACFFATLLAADFALTQAAPICDVNCMPDPASAGYGATASARTKPQNVRGANAQYSFPAAGTSPAASTLPGSESYSSAFPLLQLPGRNGLDVNLTLYYNSAVWTVDENALTITLNADRDWPSYGFRLGYGYLESSDPGTGETFTLTEADGSKRLLLLLSGNIFESQDSTYTRYDKTDTVRTLTYKSGLSIRYEPVPNQPKLFRPNRITDTNGNYITIAYVTDSWASGFELLQITDTLNRQITFTENVQVKNIRDPVQVS